MDMMKINLTNIETTKNNSKILIIIIKIISFNFQYQLII